MSTQRIRLFLVVVGWAASAPGAALAQTIPAFPGADGVARNVSGGRGGIVYHVTKLNSALDDPERNSFGTIRYALNNDNFPAGVPRTIVFDVGGVFHLGRLPQPGWDPNGNGWDAQSRLTIGGTNITLAGQTAPGAGVVFMGGGLKPQGNNNIIRNITVAAGYGTKNWFEPGDPFPAAPGTPAAGADASRWFPDDVAYDAMDIAGTDLMIDHVSLLYATDETISMNERANNVTVQYSNISQGQNYPQWDAEGGGLTGHALGSLLEAGDTTQAAISFHHNLYAHLKGRVPQMQKGGAGAYYDFRNNVFYNWFGTAGSKSGSTFLNLVNNFYLAGDGGDQPIGGTNPGVTTQGGGTGVIGASSTVYRNGNLLDSNKDADFNDGNPLPSGGAPNPLWMGGVATYHGVTEPASSQLVNRVLDYVGARWWARDSVIDSPDERIINEVRTGTGKIIAWADNPWNNDPNEGVEWRALKNTPTASRDLDWDTEPSVGYGIGDGMPTWWELAHGLDPNVHDNNGDFDNDGYTNLEEYLNEIAAWPAPAAIQFTGATNSRYALITNWDANIDPSFTHHWQPSRFDTVLISNGTVVIDAVGQHAGTLSIAGKSVDTATVDVIDGWIEAAEQVWVAGGGVGTINHSGGMVATPMVVVGGDGAASVGVYNLTGSGQLRTGTLTKGAFGGSGTFNFTGGVLSADLVTFDLINDGGVISPGDSPGTIHVVGDLAMNSGSILIELTADDGGDDPSHDRIVVDGELTAGGTLSVVLVGGFAPAAGDTFDLFDFESATGSFTLDLPPLEPGLAWDASQLLSTGELSVTDGDFDGDGDVDGADFLRWQRGSADGAGFGLWQSQFGSSPAVGGGQGVPEPCSAWLVAVYSLALAARARR